MFNNNSNQPAPILSPLPTLSQPAPTPPRNNHRKLFIIIGAAALLIIIAAIIAIILLNHNNNDYKTSDEIALSLSAGGVLDCESSAGNLQLFYDDDGNITSYKTDASGLPSTSEVEQSIQSSGLETAVNSLQDQFIDTTSGSCSQTIQAASDESE